MRGPSPALILRTALLGLIVWQASACAEPQPAPATEMTELQRGAYLVDVGACNDCHSPKIFTDAGPLPDTTRLLSGHPAGSKLPSIPPGAIGPTTWGAFTTNDLTAWVGPWGTSFAANLTPHATGLGAWTPDNFIATIRTGKHFGVGRAILPPMPWPYYAKMTDDDLRAIFAYLRSLPPVSNTVPLPVGPPGAPAPR